MRSNLKQISARKGSQLRSVYAPAKYACAQTRINWGRFQARVSTPTSIYKNLTNVACACIRTNQKGGTGVHKMTVLKRETVSWLATRTKYPSGRREKQIVSIRQGLTGSRREKKATVQRDESMGETKCDSDGVILRTNWCRWWGWGRRLQVAISECSHMLGESRS